MSKLSISSTWKYKKEAYLTQIEMAYRSQTRKFVDGEQP